VAAAKWIIQTTDMTDEQIAEFHVPVDWHEESETNEWAAHLIDWISKRLFEETKGKACVSKSFPPSPFLGWKWVNKMNSPRSHRHTPGLSKTWSRKEINGLWNGDCG
jgi:hypothetical protein